MSRTHRALRGSLSLLALSCTLAFGATVYRWTDANGVTHYSDAPPAGTNAREVVIAAAPAEAPEAADWRKRDEEFQDRHRARQKELDEAIRARRLEAELEAIKAGSRTPVPGETFAEPDFQKRVLWALVAADQALAPECATHSVARTEALGRDVDKQTLYERWVLDRCGENVAYRLSFMPFHLAGSFAPQRDGGGTKRGSHVILDDSSSFTFELEPPAG